jgi:hypothetical protein
VFARAIADARLRDDGSGERTPHLSRQPSRAAKCNSLAGLLVRSRIARNRCVNSRLRRPYSRGRNTTMPGVCFTYSRNGESTTFMFAFFDDASRSIGPSGVSMKNPACVTSSPSAFA